MQSVSWNRSMTPHHSTLDPLLIPWSFAPLVMEWASCKSHPLLTMSWLVSQFSWNPTKNPTWPLYRKAAGLPEMILPLNQSLYGCKLEEGPLLMIFSLFLVKVNLVYWGMVKDAQSWLLPGSAWLSLCFLWAHNSTNVRSCALRMSSVLIYVGETFERVKSLWP